MPLTKKEKQAYQRKINKQIKAVKKLDKETIKQIQQAANAMRKSVHDQLLNMADARSTRLNTQQIQYMKNFAATEIERFRIQAMNILTGGLSKIPDLADDAADIAIERLGLLVSPIPGAAPSMAAIAVDYGADLIRGICDETRKQINSELSRAIMGELTPYDAMKSIDKAMGVGLEKGVTAKAEKIVRTELTRAYGMNNQVGLNGIGDRLEPDERKYLKKQWISAKQPGRTRQAHWEADEQIVPYDEPFEVGGEPLMFPGDPKGSPGNTINCLCDMVIITDELLEYREQKSAGG